MIYRDQLGRTIELKSVPKRIVSLVPSQTELLYDLGLEDEVVGITKFCIHPDYWYRTKTRVGGTKQIDYKKIKALNPDLIITNKEENTREIVEVCEGIAPTWVSDIYTLSDALDMIARVGEITDRKKEADELTTSIQAEFDALSKEIGTLPKFSVKYYIWSNPNYVAGKMTFIDDMINCAGFRNAIENERYPEDDSSIHPDFIFLSSEPFPFKEKHVSSFQQEYPNSKVVIVDGELFSWYGSRLKLVPAYFKKIRDSLAQQL